MNKLIKGESLSDYMDRAMRYMQTVRDKDELVTEGIQIMTRCEKSIQEKRSKAQKNKKELMGMLNEVNEDVNSCGFELEQLNEQYERLDQEHQKQAKEEQHKSDEVDRRMAAAVIEMSSAKVQLEEQRTVFAEKLQNKMAKLEASIAE